MNRNGMKRLRYLLFLAALLTWTSCEKTPTDDPTPADPAPTDITLTPSSLSSIESGGAQFSLTVTSPSRPKLSVPDWMSFKDGTYDKYSITFAVTVPANTTYESRSGEITVTAGSLSKSLSVSQKGIEKPVVPEIDKSKIDSSPVTPSASAETKKLYAFLLDHYNRHILSGVQSSMSHTNDFVDAVYSATGSHPALAGYDFIFLQFSPTPASWSWKQDYTDISAPKEHWAKGGIVSYMWHWNVPDSETVFRDDSDTDHYGFYVKGAHNGNGETEFDIRESLKEGTWQHECILRDIDEIAITFKALQEEGIPVLFRPLHEAAGNYTRYNPGGGAWFWWGRYGAEPCKGLWNLLYDRLTNHHKLNNLLWVWTIDVSAGFETAAAEWYPGDDRVDIIGADIYENTLDAKTVQFTFMNKVSSRKMATCSECGNVPDPEKSLTGGVPWSWFMVWPTTNNNTVDISGYPLNTTAYWKTLMGSEYVLTREKMGNWK